MTTKAMFMMRVGYNPDNAEALDDLDEKIGLDTFFSLPQRVAEEMLRRTAVMLSIENMLSVEWSDDLEEFTATFEKPFESAADRSGLSKQFLLYDFQQWKKADKERQAAQIQDEPAVDDSNIENFWGGAPDGGFDGDARDPAETK